MNKTKSDEGKLASANFIAVLGGLPDSTQNRLRGIVRYMDKNGYAMYPSISNYLHMMYAGIGFRGMTEQEIDELTDVTVMVLTKNNRREQNLFFVNTGLLLEQSVIGVNRSETVMAKEGTLKFRYLKFEEFYGGEEEEYEEEETFEDEEIEEEEEDWSDESDEWGSDWGDSGDWDEWGTASEEEESFEEDENQDEEEEEETPLTLDPNVMFDNLYTPPELPTMSGPVVDIENTDLIFKSDHDFTTLYSTNIHMRLVDRVVVGEGGTIDWTRVGVSEAKATLKFYHFDADKPHLKAEQVMFSYPSKIDGEVEGVLEYRNSLSADSAKATFPRFQSFKSNVHHLDFPSNMRFQGGFTIKGTEVSTASWINGKCHLWVSLDSLPKFHAIASNFRLGDSIIRAEPAAVYLFVNGDSIYHPGLVMKYNRGSEHIALNRANNNFKFSEFNVYFHDLDFDVNFASWGLRDTVINFHMGMNRNSQAAYVSSKSTFKKNEFIRLRGLFPFHPVELAMRFYRKEKLKSFYTSDLAEGTGYSESLVNKALVVLMAYGYVDYNPGNGFVILNDKIFHYYKANKRKKDYDLINIRSIAPEGPSVSYSLNENTVIVNGVDEFSLMDSNAVRCLPVDRKIIITEGRNITFSGQILTKNYVFNGHDFEFNYDEFKINLKNIDSLKFEVEVVDTNSETGETKKLQNKLSYTSGTLEIDKPNNKSGRRYNAEYPHFAATDGASVLFNRSDIFGGIYDTTLQYKIPAFKMDSLNGTGQEGIAFDGDFTSKGIFPDFSEKLEVQEDFSLGFEHETPEDGYPLYETDARFVGTVTMSNRGLRGRGYIKFLNTTLYSEDFVFFPDSVLAIGDSAITLPGGNELALPNVTFPKMNLNEYQMKWLPKKDSMLVSTFGKPFQFYDERVTLVGLINITTEGTRGNGIVYSEGARAISENFLFNEHSFVGRESDFEILSDLPGKPAMRANHLKVVVDVDSAYATFSPELNSSSTSEFPFLSYRTSLVQGEWFINAHKVVMEKPLETPLEESFFYSTRKIQDSINFLGKRAVYVMDSLKLYTEGVPYLNFGDGRIIPEGGKVAVGKDARISGLENSQMVFDTTLKYHHFYYANANLLTTSRMLSPSSYFYVNSGNDTMTINFERFEYGEFEVDEKTGWHTHSREVITEEDQFFIAPNTLFRGKIDFYSKRKALIFDGEIMVDLSGGGESSSWIKYYKDDVGNDVIIDLSALGKSSEDDPSKMGTLWYSAGHRIYYGKFLDAPVNTRDQQVFGASGLLSQDFALKQFQIGDTLAVNGTRNLGNVFRFFEAKGEYQFVGHVDLLTNDPAINQNVNVSFAGEGVNSVLDSSFAIKGITNIQYDLPSDLFDFMSDDLIRKTKKLGAPKIIQDEERLYRDIANITQDEKAAIKIKEAFEIYVPSLAEAHKSLSNGIVLNNVNLSYSVENKAWYSTGPLPISNINKTKINAEVRGALEIQKTRGGDIINLYIELSDAVFYYFSFNKNNMTAVSSHPKFNTLMEEENEIPTKIGAYYIQYGRTSSKNKFVNLFKERYLNGEHFVDPANEYPDADLMDENTVTPKRISTFGDLDNPEGDSTIVGDSLNLDGLDDLDDGMDLDDLGDDLDDLNDLGDDLDDLGDLGGDLEDLEDLGSDTESEESNLADDLEDLEDSETETIENVEEETVPVETELESTTEEESLEDQLDDLEDFGDSETETTDETTEESDTSLEETKKDKKKKKKKKKDIEETVEETVEEAVENVNPDAEETIDEATESEETSEEESEDLEDLLNGL